MTIQRLSPPKMRPPVSASLCVAGLLILTACARTPAPVEGPAAAVAQADQSPTPATVTTEPPTVTPSSTPPPGVPAGARTYVASSAGTQGEVLYPQVDAYLSGIEQHVAEMKKRGFLDKPPIARVGPEAEVPGCALAQHYPYGHERKDGGLVAYSSVFRCSDGAYLIIEESDYALSPVKVSYTAKGQPNSRVRGLPAVYTNLRDPTTARVMQSLRWQRKPRTYNIVYVGNTPLATHTLINLANFIGRTP